MMDSAKTAVANRRTLRQELSRLSGGAKRRIRGFIALNGSWLWRRWRYRTLTTRAYPQLINQLKQDGCAVFRNAINPALLLELRAEAEEHLTARTCLSRMSKDSVRPVERVDGHSVFLTPEEVALGERYWREHTNNVQITDPLLNCPAAVTVAFQPLLIDIATGYLGCLPAIGGANLRKSYANTIPPFSTNYFHCDGNSKRFLKCFFYLNDVDEHGGPFCYVRGSHRQKFDGWRKKYRWSFDEIAAQYGEDRIVNLTANLGDLVIADTTGFHRGTKVRSTDRWLWTMNYDVEPEYGGTQRPFKILQSEHDKLSRKQRAVADFLEVVAGAEPFAASLAAEGPGGY
jgi:hypothetical protein